MKQLKPTLPTRVWVKNPSLPAPLVQHPATVLELATLVAVLHMLRQLSLASMLESRSGAWGRMNRGIPCPNP